MRTRLDILDRIYTLITMHPDNYWLTQGGSGSGSGGGGELSALSILIDSIPRVATECKALILRILDHVVTGMNTVPFQEMRSLTYLLRGQTEPYRNRLEIAETVMFAVGGPNSVEAPAALRAPAQHFKSMSSPQPPPSMYSPLSGSGVSLGGGGIGAVNAVSSRPTVSAASLYYPDTPSVNLLLQTINQCIAFETSYQDVFRGCGMLDLLVFHFQHLNEHCARTRTAAAATATATATATASATPTSTSQADVKTPVSGNGQTPMKVETFSGDVDPLANLMNSRRNPRQTIVTAPPPAPLAPSARQHVEPPIFLDDDAYILALKSLQIMIDGNTTNLRMFRACDGATALYSLLREESRRSATLSILARQLDQQNFQDMIIALQSEKGMGLTTACVVGFVEFGACI